MIIGFILAGLGAVAKVVPYIAIVEIARSLLTGSTTGPGPWVWVPIAIAAMIGHTLAYNYALGSNHFAEAKLRNELRQRLVTKLGRVSLGWFTARSSGQIRQAVTKDTSAIHALVAHLAGDFANSLFSMLASLGYLFWLDWHFASMLLGGLIVLLIVVLLISMTGLTDIFRRYAESERSLATSTVELVDGIKEVKNFGITDEVFGRFDRAQRHHAEVSLAWLRKQSLGTSLLGSAMQPAVVFAVTAALGLLGTLQGWLDPITVLAFALVWVGLPEGLLALVGITQLIYTAKQAANSTLAILQAPELPEPSPPPLAEPAPPTAIGAIGQRDTPIQSSIAVETNGLAPAPGDAPAIEFRDVTFCYEAGEQVISHLSLSCAPGTVTALVGPSGGGKSTLAKLIARFWDVDSGAVLVNGRDVRDIPTRELMGAISLVFQEVMLSTDTVRANIALGRAGATDAAIAQAARAACIHDRIRQLPAGYDTVVGAGAHFSGGEAQRLTIARAFLAAAPILILDEATAQADAHSERLIQQAISNLAAGRTVIVIAHRLDTIRGVDQIAVIDEGRLTECGTHDQLITGHGRYARLWQGQHHADSALAGKEQSC